LLWLLISYAALAVFESEAVAIHLEDVNVMGTVVEQAARAVLAEG
jgi:hypothetical protein